jgi:hypothetical protein
MILATGFTFLISQTNYIRSLAAVEADVDSATYVMVAQCGAGGQPKLDLHNTYEVVVLTLGKMVV